jgi:RNA-directed DNA polymerase
LANNNVHYWILRFARIRLSVGVVSLGLWRALDLPSQRIYAHAHKLESIFGSCAGAHWMLFIFQIPELMNQSLREELRTNIKHQSIEDLCESINKIGPYVSGLAIGNPLSVSVLKHYTEVRARKTSYRKFRIPKKSVGARTITAPYGELKDIMSTLAFLLSQLYTPTPEATAFIAQRSIVDNASQHLNHNYILNLDLSDFFTSITAGMVEKGLKKIGLSTIVAQCVATICTYPAIEGKVVKNIVPQGAPTSPVISNICAMTLDSRLSGLARRFHLYYTRYADDITFSSNHNVYHAGGEFMEELYHIIEDCHFVVNSKKTRLQKRGTRQEVTGLTVTGKLNVSRKYVKNLRVLIHHIRLTENPSLHEVNVVRGKLNFLRMVKGSDDTTYQTLLMKLNLAVRGKHFLKPNQQLGIGE